MKKQIKQTAFVAFSSLSVAALLVACGGGGFQLKDVTKDGIKISAKDKDKDKNGVPAGADLGTTPTKGTTAISGGTTGVAKPPVGLGRPLTTAGTTATGGTTATSQGTTATSGTTAVVSPTAGSTAVSGTTATSQGTTATSGTTAISGRPQVTNVVEIQKDGNIALKKSYELDLRGEKIQFSVSDKRLFSNIKEGEEDKTSVTISFDLGTNHHVVVTGLQHSKKDYLAQKTVPRILTTEKHDMVSAYVSSYCRLSSENEAENDKDCKRQVVIIDFLLENGNFEAANSDDDKIKRIGIAFDEAKEPVVITSDIKEGEEEYTPEEFEKLLRSKLQ